MKKQLLYSQNGFKDILVHSSSLYWHVWSYSYVDAKIEGIGGGGTFNFDLWEKHHFHRMLYRMRKENMQKRVNYVLQGWARNAQVAEKVSKSWKKWYLNRYDQSSVAPLCPPPPPPWLHQWMYNFL